MSEMNGEHAARMLKSRLATRAMTRLGLRYVSTDELTIRRKRVGDKSVEHEGTGRVGQRESAFVQAAANLHARIAQRRGGFHHGIDCTAQGIALQLLRRATRRRHRTRVVLAAIPS